MVESACMMLDHIDEGEMAGKIRNSVARVISEGIVRTYDMMKMTGREEVIKNGAASTKQMADAIIENL
jgi:isocitrate/isopropylmalate dehydrogenase